jgi:hypothetical protein
MDVLACICPPPVHGAEHVPALGTWVCFAVMLLLTCARLPDVRSHKALRSHDTAHAGRLRLATGLLVQSEGDRCGCSCKSRSTYHASWMAELPACSVLGLPASLLSAA